MLAGTSHAAAVTGLGDEELVQRLKQLLSEERAVHTQLLVHLAEVDARGLYLERAYPSMFEYCVKALHMSEAEAYLRIRAARLGRQFPHIWHLLERGELHLSGLKLLAPVLDEHNADDLLEAARGKSKRELELLLAARFAKPDVPALIRKLPERAPPRATQAAMTLPLDAAEMPSSAAEGEGAATRAELPRSHGEQAPIPQPRFALQPLAPVSARPTLAPLSRSRYKLQLTASQQLHDKLQQARDLMRHELPDGDLAQVVERALDLLIAERMKRRFGIGRKPRVAKQAPKTGSRHIPHAVSRKVVARDHLQCTFVSPDGRRCSERGWLELHHETPFGRGGPATDDNIRVLCKAHNLLLAERDYGPDFIQQRIEQARRRAKERPPSSLWDQEPVARRGRMHSDCGIEPPRDCRPRDEHPR